MPVWLDLQVKQGFGFPPTLAPIYTFWMMRTKPTTRKYPLSTMAHCIISLQLSVVTCFQVWVYYVALLISLQLVPV